MTIGPGERSSAVRELHRSLIRLGHDLDPREIEEGHFGPVTEAAVRAFQQIRGLDVDGIVGEATGKELQESSWSLGNRRLYLTRPPLRGDDVRALQSQLNALGFSAGKHDGIFGPRTVEAVREFQHDMAIGEDGIVGTETIQALHRLIPVLRQGLGPRVRERELRRAVPVGLAGKRIALDPGHGGPDPGAISPWGDTEAGIAFHLAATLARRLEHAGATAVLTRGPHEGPSDSERAGRANEFGADLLVSIHLNAHPSQEASGVAAYFFEHQGVASEPGEHLADSIRGALVSSGRGDCWSHGRNYLLLRETEMPAIVVEPCFISNLEEAKLLAEPGGLAAVAEAIFEGLRRYFSEE